MKNLILLSLLVFLFSCTKSRDTSIKELRLLSVAKIAGLDPANISDNYSSMEAGKVYEALYEFHPFKRPYVLMPNLAESMPEVSSDGLTYTIKLKKSVLFHNDKAFPNGKGREMTADDVIFTIKRLADPKLQARGWWVLDGKILGLNKWREKYASADKANYDDEIEGLKKIDSHTISFKLTKPFPQFLYALVMTPTYVVAKEVVNHYGEEFLNHPVGTGPFIMKSLDPNKLVYERNPIYREKFFPTEGEEGDKEKGLLADAGKKIPFLDRIVVSVIEEAQPAWMSFQKGKIDVMTVPKDNFDEALDEKKELKPKLKEKGLILTISPMLDVTYLAFNLELPIFKNQKLRQAMSLAYDRNNENKLFFNGTAMSAQGPIPPGIAGYDEVYQNPFTKYDLVKAKKLLAEAGYPDGKGLPELVFESMASTQARQQSEYFQRNMDKLGVKVRINNNTWPELSDKVHRNKHQLYGMAWVADYPDAENFLGLLYCPNKNPGSNGANYCNPEFDKLFEQATIMQDSPQRTALYQKLNQMVAEDVPWLFSFHRTRYYLNQGWVRNYKVMEFAQTQAQYLDIDQAKKAELLPKF